MLATVVLIAVILALVAFAACWYYLTVLDRRTEAAQIARIKRMSPDEQQTMLRETRIALRDARRNFEYIHELWAKYKWGRTRHNPHYIPRLGAAMECARLRHLLNNLEKAVIAV